MKAQHMALVLATGSLLAAEVCAPRHACAGITIHQLVKDANGGNDGPNDGELTVGKFMFTFDSTNGGVTGNRNWDQVSVAAAGNNGVTFTIDPSLSLASNQMFAQSASINIDYTITSTISIVGAGLSDDAAAQDITQSAKSGVTETVNPGGMLFVGQEQNKPNVPRITFAEAMTLSVSNFGDLSIPDRRGGAMDTATLSSITNTFSTLPEPPSLVVLSALLGMFGFVWARNRLSPCANSR
jgi:hypothetical protein